MDKKTYRLTASIGGRLIEDREFENWAQIGGKVGNLVGDADVISVYEGKGKAKRVLLYNAVGIY